MALFERVLQKELRSLEDEQVRIRFLGDLEALPSALQERIADATERTKDQIGAIATDRLRRRLLRQGDDLLANVPALGHQPEGLVETLHREGLPGDRSE